MVASSRPATRRASRRAFLRSVLAATVGATVVPSTTAGAAGGDGASGPYGDLAERDDSGLLLPDGFSARVVARSGRPVGSDGFVWRGSPDGAATFDDGAGGWYHAVNHELHEPGGGVSVVHYDTDGEIVDAYSVLDGTDRNCAGGPTPWGTWLSCEEVERGLVYECEVTGPGQGRAVPSLGRFRHEAAAVDPVRRRLYLTEDQPDGLLYRFTPARYPALDDGVLDAAVLDGGAVTWIPVPDPQATDVETRFQLDDAAHRFSGGEGICYHDDRVWFTTKGDSRVWELDVRTDRLTVVYDSSRWSRPVLTGVDNITVDAGTGDLLVAEDDGNMEVVVITAAGSVSPLLRIPGHVGSEVTGPAFDPAGARLYLSSQRGSDGAGVTYEVTGPFRGRTGPAPTDHGGELAVPGLPVIGVGVAAAAGLAVIARRRRSRSGPEPAEPAGGRATQLRADRGLAG